MMRLLDDEATRTLLHTRYSSNTEVVQAYIGEERGQDMGEQNYFQGLDMSPWKEVLLGRSRCRWVDNTEFDASSLGLEGTCEERAMDRVGGEGLSQLVVQKKIQPQFK